MSDTISRAKAIDGKICVRRSNGVEIYDDYVVPVEYLEQLPPAQPSTGDCCGCNCPKMERLAQPEPSQVAKDIARIVGNENDMRVIAQPERIKGNWIESNGLNILMKKFIEKGETWRVCDKCGAGFMIGYQYECDKLYHETFHNFCPKCGADMREVTE